MTLISKAPRTWTRSEYQRLGELGVFDDDRVELFRGEIVQMSPQDPLHSGAVENLSSLLFAVLGGRKTIRIQLPFQAPDNSEPEPDAVVLDREYALRCRQGKVHPERAELIVEVARTSLEYDRLEKSSLYAQAGVPQYWIVNLVDMLVETYSEPGADNTHPFGWSYKQRYQIRPDGELSFQGHTLGVAEIFSGFL